MVQEFITCLKTLIDGWPNLLCHRVQRSECLLGNTKVLELLDELLQDASIVEDKDVESEITSEVNGNLVNSVVNEISSLIGSLSEYDRFIE